MQEFGSRMEPVDANSTGWPKESIIDLVSNLNVVNRYTCIREGSYKVASVSADVSESEVCPNERQTCKFGYLV